MNFTIWLYFRLIISQNCQILWEKLSHIEIFNFRVYLFEPSKSLGLKLINFLSKSLLQFTSFFIKSSLVFVNLEVKIFERLSADISRFHDLIISTETLQRKKIHDLYETIIDLSSNYTHFLIFNVLDVLCQRYELSSWRHAFGD